MASGDLAFVFPGQGSQSVGMLASQAAAHPQILDTFAEASEVLGYDLWQRAQQGSAAQLALTECTQPLLLSAGIAIWRLWEARGGPMPAQMAGHSLGEWSALVAAGALDFRTAVDLVRLRGAAMQSACAPDAGAMAAIIGLGDAQVEQCCAAVGDAQGFVGPANYNAPGQVVIAGARAAVESAMAACREAGARRALPLPVSAPFHTPLMQPAADAMALALESAELRAPAVPIVHNASLDSCDAPQQMRALMVEQICAPVRWGRTVELLAGRGARTLVECGPGQVLCGLGRRINKELRMLATDDMEKFDASMKELQDET